MKKKLCAGMMLSCLPVFCTTITTSDYPQFTSDALDINPAIVVLYSDFHGNVSHQPSITIKSISGPAGQFAGDLAYANNTMYDNVGPHTNTGLMSDHTIITDTVGPLYGWGGWFDIPESRSGLTIFGYPTPTTVIMDNGDYAPFHGFWGFLTTDPFNALDISASIGSTHYSMTGMVEADPPVTATPEPGMMATVGLTLLAFGMLFRRRSRVLEAAV